MLEIWHNPRCSKSRQTLAIIEEAGAEVRVRRYIDDVPSMTELNRVLRALEVEPTALVRIGEPVAKQLKLKSRELSRSEWLTVLVAHPILIERPIVIRDDGRAIVGRPPENVRDLL
jgi:arsenate reductase